MKTNVKLLLVISLLVSACTTGSMVTSSSYTDDAYFTPGDHPPVTGGTVSTHQQSAKQSTTITGMRQEEAARIVDNYYSDQKDGNLKSDPNTVGNEPADSGNSYQADEEAKDFIENYDEPEDIDYTTRIRTFYDPYAYDPYWDSYYSPGFGFGWGIGMGFGFGGFYGGYYSPFYGYGWGGYPYWGWGGYPYWGWGGHHGGGYHNGGYGNNNNRYYGRQNPGGRVSSNAIGYSGSGRGSVVGSTYSGGRSIGRAFSGTSGITSRGSNVINTGGAIGSTRQAGTRFTVNPNITKSAGLNGASQQGTTNNAQTSVNLRRGQMSTNQNAQTVRPGISTNGGTRYTPTYSRPRTNIQATYNNGAARQYSRPQSYSGTNSSGRSTISGSYQRGSSRAPVVSGSSGRSSGVSGGQSRSSSSGSYSAPLKSSSSGSSFSGGGGGGGGRSSGGSGGGGGGGGRRR